MPCEASPLQDEERSPEAECDSRCAAGAMYLVWCAALQEAGEQGGHTSVATNLGKAIPRGGGGGDDSAKSAVLSWSMVACDSRSTSCVPGALCKYPPCLALRLRGRAGCDAPGASNKSV